MVGCHDILLAQSVLVIGSLRLAIKEQMSHSSLLNIYLKYISLLAIGEEGQMLLFIIFVEFKLILSLGVSLKEFHSNSSLSDR